MLYYVSFSGQDNGTTCKFEIRRDVTSINVIMRVGQDVLCEESIGIQEMHALLDEYRLNDGYYENRELTKVLKIKERPKIISTLFRAFAASFCFLDYTGGYTKNSDGSSWEFDGFVKHIIDSLKKDCYHSSRIEPAGPSSNKRTAMYFLKKEYDRNDSNILSLYNMGLLHKLEGKIKSGELSEEFSVYYIPFDVLENREFPTPATKAVWNKISHEMREVLPNYPTVLNGYHL